MKKILFVVCLLFTVQLYATASQEKPVKKEPQKKETYVYICDSKTAYAYHTSTSCRGLNRCTHRVVKMTESDAKGMRRTPCKVCH